MRTNRNKAEERRLSRSSLFSEELERVLDANGNGGVDAYEQLCDFIRGAENTAELTAATYALAVGLEMGDFHAEPKRREAYDQYDWICRSGVMLRSQSLLGCARTTYWGNLEGGAEKAIRLCHEAIALGGSVQAMMFLGLLLDESDNQRSARIWFRKAFRAGSPWGLRFCAHSHYNQGNRIRAVIYHVLATTTAPLIFAIKGRQPIFGP